MVYKAPAYEDLINFHNDTKSNLVLSKSNGPII